MTKEAYNQLYSILETIKESVEYMENREEVPLRDVDFLFDDLRNAVWTKYLLIWVHI